MSYYASPPQHQPYGAQNLQFYPSSYGNPVSGHSTPANAQYGGSPYAGGASQAGQGYGYGAPTGFMSPPAFGRSGQGVSGRMGEQGGLRTGWLAAFGTEGYEGEGPRGSCLPVEVIPANCFAGEPPLLEELG
jgi:protein YIPF5/7